MASTMIGVAATNKILSNQLVIDMADKLYLLEPNAAPLYVMVSKLNKRPAINPVFYWMEDVLNPSWDTLGVSLTATDGTQIDTTNSGYLNPYDLVRIIETGEILLITSVNVTAATAVRGYAGSTAATASGGWNLLIIGSAFEEGSAYSTLKTKSTKATSAINYCQIFRKSVEITKTLANTELYGTPDRAYQRKKKGIEMMRDMERAFIFGKASQDTGSTDTSLTYSRRTTGGINAFISTNSTNAGGVLTESEFEGFLRTVFRYGSNSRYLFCAPLILSVISQWAQGKLQIFPKDKTYGIAITQLISPHGSVNLVKEILLEHAGSVSSTSYFGGYAYAIELEDVVYRFLQNRDVQMETDIQLPGDDLYKDQYIGEVGMEFHNEQKHGVLTGVTG